MGQGSSRPETQRRSRLHRASTTLTSIPQIFSRRRTQRDAISSPRPNSIAVTTPSRRQRPLSTAAPNGATPNSLLPSLQLPDLDLNFDSFTSNNEEAIHSRRHNGSSTRRQGTRPTIIDRMANMRPHRRRSLPRREEDQAAMLSRLLSVAAAATAASLMGEDHRTVSDARNLGNDDEDGTFDSFLQALQNGRIASALRGENTGDGDNGGMPAPLNFFRMFRFGANSRNPRIERPSSNPGTGNRAADQQNPEEEGRMVPIIIVGIRSINPGTGASQDDNIPPFLDALSTFPTPINTTGENPMDGLLRQPTPTTRFSHRRRASMGGFPTTYDNQRHHPRPPPSTPASSALSALSSGNTTPTRNPSTTNHSAAPSRRDSFVRRAAGGLETTAEEPSQQRTARQRRLSESDFTRFGSGSSRRNGVVEPDNIPSEGSRSWIIYVLGGSYPENHPILTTPSLFTDSPTYEDMLLLSALLGPAKPPVASEADVASAPGLFKIVAAEEEGRVMAVPATEAEEETETETEVTGEDEDSVTVVDTDVVEDEAKEEKAPTASEDRVREKGVILIAPDQRCLVCLSDFEIGEEARRLVECQHLFHRECIDHWLLNGRNSCPLCRRRGVTEKQDSPTTSTSEETSTSPTSTTSTDLSLDASSSTDQSSAVTTQPTPVVTNPSTP